MISTMPVDGTTLMHIKAALTRFDGLSKPEKT